MARGLLSSSDAASDASCPEKWWSGAVQAGQHTGQLEEAAIFVAPVVTVSALQCAQPTADEQQHASWGHDGWAPFFPKARSHVELSLEVSTTI